MNLPSELPLDGAGCHRKMALHLNFPGGGAATYTITGPGGIALPVHYQYDSRKKGAAETGYFIAGIERCFKSWRELAEFWPEYIKSKHEAAS